MDILKQTIGLALIILAWLDPLELGMTFQVLLFILGFDLVHLIPKVIIFMLDYFYDLSGLGWMLLLLIGVESALELLKIKSFINLVAKPLVVFLIIYFNNLGLELAVIIAGIDLLLNIGKKYI